MFNCDQCASTFTRKDNLVAHRKKHVGVRFPCTACPSKFNEKSNLNKHNMKNVHGNIPAHLRPTEPIIDQSARPSVIQFAPRINGPQIVVPAGGLNVVSDDTCVIIEDEDTG
ncbi:hypothetical protein ACI65C_006401 [Semiaphis heraclei]